MEYKPVNNANETGGKVVFAEDVVATIASLAASEVEGVYGMSGSTFEGLGEKLGKKNYTKGIKVEVGTVECAVDMTLIVKYGYRIQEVCQNVQQAVKNAIENMTGLNVVEVNISVNSVVFAEEKKVEEAPKPVEQPNRVK
ncbi:MAG: Asp23/Gls24 family envelope stress response protein [Clostridia bacterium]|nr:Asp23/Gls24 family envelope stress response protein [Clostridia bacterium]